MGLAAFDHFFTITDREDQVIVIAVRSGRAGKQLKQDAFLNLLRGISFNSWIPLRVGSIFVSVSFASFTWDFASASTHFLCELLDRKQKSRGREQNTDAQSKTTSKLQMISF